MATYDNGLYTPWTPAGEAAATTSAAGWTADESSWDDESDQTWDATTTSTAADEWDETTRGAAWSNDDARMVEQLDDDHRSNLVLLFDHIVFDDDDVLSRNDHYDELSFCYYATVSRYSNPSGTALPVSNASESSSGGASSFKITYLIPVFVGVPILLLFLFLACTHGKYWGRSREPKTPFTDPVGAVTGWWGGTWRSRRGAPDDGDEVDETGGLVASEKWAGGADDYDEKPASRWSGMFGAAGKGGSAQREDRPDVPFLSVSHATPEQRGDAPFVPPSRSSSTYDFPRWGQVAPQAPSRGQHLAAGVWGMGSSSQRWGGGGGLQRGASMRSTTSYGSRLSDKIFGRFGARSGAGHSPPSDCPSPSVYSPQVDAGHMGGVGAYMGLHSALDEEDEEEILRDEKKVDYDALLGAARIGDSMLADKYVKGEVTDAELFPPPALDQQRYPTGDARERYYSRHAPPQSNPFDQPYRDSPPTFAVDLPAAPSRLQVSPKKQSTVLTRATAPETPERGPTGNLLFSYDSPPVYKNAPPSAPSSAQRPPLPPAPRTSSAAPLTEAPARIPFRQQAAPQLSRPLTQRVLPTPLSPEAQPDLFFASPPLSRNAVGSPMPAYEPRADSSMRASESLMDLDGVGALVFGGAAAPEPSTSAQKRKSVASGRTSPSKAHRRSESEQIRRSSTLATGAPSEVKPGMVIPSAVALQANMAPSCSSGAVPRSSSARQHTPTKSRPMSAYAQLPTQSRPQQREHESNKRVSKVPSQQSLRPVKSALSSRPSRDSLGFNPSFDDGPPLVPLQHPSKVKAAIETIETRSSSALGHRKTASRDSGRSEPSSSSSHAHRLERAATSAAPASTSYRRPLGNKGLDSDDEEDGLTTLEDDDGESRAANRRLSMLILNRSKSHTGASGPLSSEGHGSAEDEARRQRPLSSDPKRLGAMLRRPSQGAGLGSAAPSLE
ncbi:hypothetical protein Rhopal_004871-T1 [Rhodotorula paludigena]|uniref:Proteophosphoglycan ppg4 n=1 Tax=Rhodotorula paludigena TaxID=86838 RepID=A0AAV5GNU1_9BASI|nr:hypothetical protein Rhopal_004871-T1 [Rhodotorula paludigena]